MTVSADYIILGGGVAGLTLAALLAGKNRDVLLIEKSSYPKHRVCGEYLSNEVIPFLMQEDLYPEKSAFPEINRFELSDIEGRGLEMDLDLGGFGISRYALDQHLFDQGKQRGARIHQNEKVTNVRFDKNIFHIETNKDSYTCNWLIGAFGKRSAIDRILNRPFMQKRSPYMGVKYHVKNPSLRSNTVALHNFPGGYCGVNAVENNTINICYLAHRSSMENARSIREMESNVLFKNPRIQAIFSESEFLWDKPEVINEISFETKSPVDEHILMCGDAAGMITPLCGNGMAMAMHSAKLLFDVLNSFHPEEINDREALEQAYRNVWSRHFSTRLSTGRKIQRLFGNGSFSGLTVRVGKSIPAIGHWLMRQTHGKPF
ncbi:NAD(P)/FAD-dependent oxidoreductase [Fulvivirga sedimenti]|uniref:FAD-dependent monooxygenase n=1 Tax=Fulvivirga sedimenti TaxID=2879465 RepID=A0A9X1HXQ3_9BACT|nr:FAD-dependent monooxygenase [Fulvivirga sedimenti]MCA6078397.1 FAD-dependent monooxygenase [Fulvivirga sedimenti]